MRRVPGREPNCSLKGAPPQNSQKKAFEAVPFNIQSGSAQKNNAAERRIKILCFFRTIRRNGLQSGCEDLKATSAQR